MESVPNTYIVAPHFVGIQIYLNLIFLDKIYLSVHSPCHPYKGLWIGNIEVILSCSIFRIIKWQGPSCNRGDPSPKYCIGDKATLKQKTQNKNVNSKINKISIVIMDAK